MTPKLVRRSERLQTKRLVCTCPVPCPITCTPNDDCFIDETIEEIPIAEYVFFKQHHSHCDPEKYSYPGLPVEVLEMGDPEYIVSKAKMPFYDMLGDLNLPRALEECIFYLCLETVLGTWANTLWKTFGLVYVDGIMKGFYRHGIILHPPLALKLAQEVQNYMYSEWAHTSWFKSPVTCAMCPQIICDEFETTACCHHMIHSMCRRNAWKENQNTCPVCKQSCVWRCDDSMRGNLLVGKKL